MFSFAQGFLFGKPADEAAGRDADPVKAQLREWKAGMNKEMRDIDRQCREIDRTIEKHKKEITKMMKQPGQEANVRTLAKGIVKGNKTKEHLLLTKAQINSIAMQLGEQAAQLRVAKVLTKNTGIMKDMSRLMRAPEISAEMRRMGEEMSKAGIISEMMDDAMEEAMPVEDADVDEVVEGVLFEVTAGAMGKPLPTALPQAQQVAAPAAASSGRVAVLEGGGSASAGAGGGSSAAGGGFGTAEYQNRFNNI